jgi:hypothetical protein
LVLKRSLSGVAPAYFVVAFTSLMISSLPSELLLLQRFELMLNPTLAGGPLWFRGVRFGFAVLSIALLALQIGLTRPLRMMMVRSVTAPDSEQIGVGEALKLSLQRFLPVFANLWLVLLSIGVGTLFCIVPGVALTFFLMSSPFLVAACGDDAVGAYVRSFKLATRQLAPLIVLTGITLAFGTAAVILGLTSTASLLEFGRWGFFGVRLGIHVLVIPLGFFMWAFVASTFITIEAADSGAEIRQ